MAKIKFKRYFTGVVEHFLRMAVRYNSVSESTPKKWYDFTKNWIDNLSEEDRKFINFVFDYQFYDTSEGLYCFENDEIMYTKRERLALLELQFAIDAGLYAEEIE